MDGLVERIILLTLAIAILFYSIAYVILPAFNITYNTTITGINASVLQGLFFLLFMVIIFAFLLMIVYTAIKKKG